MHKLCFQTEMAHYLMRYFKMRIPHLLTNTVAPFWPTTLHCLFEGSFHVLPYGPNFLLLGRNDSRYRLFGIDRPQFLKQLSTKVHTKPVSEIKGAPCTRRAHFHGRVHDFRRCAPSVCMFFEPFCIAIYWEGAWTIFRVHSFRGSAPCECTKYKLISDTANNGKLTN